MVLADHDFPDLGKDVLFPSHEADVAPLPTIAAVTRARKRRAGEEKRGLNKEIEGDQAEGGQTKETPGPAQPSTDGLNKEIEVDRSEGGQTKETPGLAQPTTDGLDRENIVGEQSRDQFCADIITYLEEKRLPTDPVREKLTLTYADHMANENGILVFYPRFKKKGSKYTDLKGKIVIPEAMQNQVVAVLHDNIMLGGHVGRNVLYEKVYSRYWFRNMTSIIAQYVRTCAVCTRKKRVAQPNHNMQVFETPPYPFSHIAIDVIGKIKPSQEGHEYILTVICMLTNFCEAIPLKDQTSEDIVDALVNQIYTRYGPPRIVHSDNGPSLVSRLTREVHERLGIKQTFTSGMNARANGRVERIQKQLQSVISCYVDTESDNWHKLLPFALYSVRTAATSRLGDSPFRLLFGHSPTMLPIDDEMEKLPVPLSTADYLSRLQERLVIVREMAEEHKEKYTNRMKNRLDKTARPALFKVGEKVVVLDPKYKQKPLGKFSYIYLTPHEVVDIVSDCLVRLKDLKTGRQLKRLTNVNRLRRFYAREGETLADPGPKKVDPKDRFTDERGDTYYPIKRVVTSRKIGGKKQYKVHWADGSMSWVDSESISLTKHLNRKQTNGS